MRQETGTTKHKSSPALAISLFVLVSGLLSPVSCLVTEAAELKVGYANVAKIFDSYQRTKDSEAVLEQQGKAKQADLQGRFEDLKKMRQGLELLSDQARDAKGKELEERSDEFQRLKTRTERDLLHSRNELAKQIIEEISKVVSDYAKANGFTILYDSRSLLYGDAGYDVTDQILKILNDRYAASHGGQPKKP